MADINYKLALAIYLYKDYHVLLQLLIFNTSWKELRVESRVRHCAQGKTDRTALQIFSGADFMRPIPHV